MFVDAIPLHKTQTPLTSRESDFSLGLSISHRVSVPGAVRLVRITQFLELLHHCRKRSRENPHCMSDTLASTT